jgi:hypothetical protein
MSGNALERRIKMERARLRSMFNVGTKKPITTPVPSSVPTSASQGTIQNKAGSESTPSPIGTMLTPSPIPPTQTSTPTQTVTPTLSPKMSTPVPQLQDVNTSISTSLNYPAALKTNVVFSPKKEVWDRVNTHPLLSQEPALIKGMATIESGGNEKAKSWTGVTGLMQVTKPVAESYGLNKDVPEENLLAGKKYILGLLEQFDGNLRLALTAYNAGPGTMSQAIKETGTTDWPTIKTWLKGHLSKSKYAEAEDYADKVISAASHYMTPGNEADDSFAELMAESGVLKI